MTPTIEDFDNVVWSLDSIGPEVAEPAVLKGIVDEVLPAGRLAAVVRDKLIVWLHSEESLHRAFLDRLRSEDGLEYSDFAALSVEPRRAIREAEWRITEFVREVRGVKLARFTLEVVLRFRAIG
jgi:hypothetical protein